MNKLETVAIVGVSVDENSSFMRGTAAAPRHIREALHSGSTNLCAENGVDLKTDPRWWDAGDVGSAEEQPSFTQIEEHLDGLLGQGAAVISLGGDHSITYPLVRAHARTHTGLNLLHLDAHPDLYDELDGSRISHACPFARILEEELVARLVSIGIRTANPHQRQQAERFGVETYGVTDDWSAALASLRPPLYLSLDLDVLDPAFAPGVSHYEPGGLSTRDVLEILHDLPCPPIGADIVELNPDRDLHGVTAMVAAKLLKEIIALMLVSPSSSTLPVWS
ncbi:MAG: agmatinase [Acidobacteria bacterium]|nr:agmatinase [Candidatus Sulfomarinibacter sp. MAG AM1]